MKFPPKEICPRIKINDETVNEAEPYILHSLIRGLYVKDLIPWSRCDDLLRAVTKWQKESPETTFERSEVFEHVSELASRFNQERLWEDKRIGIHGEMAFHIYRNCDYYIAFAVAWSYAWHGYKIKEETGIRIIQILPDACLDRTTHPGNCLGSEIIDVKTHRRRERNDYVGLSIHENFWSSHRHNPFYVAVSQRKRKNPPYDVIDYAILGCAFNHEINALIPNNKGWRFIHFHDLHPIDLLTPSRFETDETILSRLLCS